MKNIPLSETEIKEIKDHYSQELEKIQKRAVEIRGILQKIESVKKTDEPKTSKTAGKTNKNVGKKVAKEEVLNNITAPVSEKSKSLEKVNKTAKKDAKKSSKPAVAKPAVKDKVKKVEKKTEKKANAVSKSKTKTAETKAPAKPVTKVTGKAGKKVLKAANVEIKKAKSVKKTAGDSNKGRKKSTDSKKAVYENFLLNLFAKEKKPLTSKVIFDAVEKEYNVPAADYTKMKATVTVILSKEKAGGKIKDVDQKGTKAKLYGLTEWFDDKGNLKNN